MKQDLILSIAKNCETLIHQTHTNPEETFKFKLIKPRKTFHFNPPILIEGSWMIGLTILEVYNSISNLTEESNKFELYKFTYSKIGGISYEKYETKMRKTWELQISQSLICKTI